MDYTDNGTVAQNGHNEVMIILLKKRGRYRRELALFIIT